MMEDIPVDFLHQSSLTVKTEPRRSEKVLGKGLSTSGNHLSGWILEQELLRLQLVKAVVSSSVLIFSYGFPLEPQIYVGACF